MRTAPVMPDIQPALRLWAHPRPLTAPTPPCPYAAYNSSSTPCPHPTWLRPPPAASQSRTPPRSVPPEATLCHYIQRHARTKAAAQPHQQPAPAAARALHTCDQRRAHSLSDGRLLLHHQNHKSGNQAVPIAPAATHTPLDPKQEHQPDALVCINHLDTPDDGAAQKQAPRMSTRPRLLAPMTGAPDGSL